MTNGPDDDAVMYSWDEQTSGLIDWFQDAMIREGTIGEDDLALFQIVDKPDQVVDAIFDHYSGRPITPSAREAEVLMDL